MLSVCSHGTVSAVGKVRSHPPPNVMQVRMEKCPRRAAGHSLAWQSQGKGVGLTWGRGLERDLLDYAPGVEDSLEDRRSCILRCCSHSVARHELVCQP